ncbi:hypothetical protein [Undibacterium sp. Ren11W]|uniref:hypothetical protein n=1 Tax=Undibacterium sp. Ren11W TaxID=3413045 RepID=UPI003BF3A9FC
MGGLPMHTSQYPLFNIDSALTPLAEPDVTASIIEARVSSLAFRNFDFMERQLPFIIECCTYNAKYWFRLAEACDQIYFIRHQASIVLVFPQTSDCGCIRTYRFRPNGTVQLPPTSIERTLNLSNEETLYEILDTPSNRYIFNVWHNYMIKATELPTELVTGRMANTSVDRAMIFSKGAGCVVCGDAAKCYAATTIGNIDNAFMVQLPVCSTHLDDAKRHPSIFMFFASLFGIELEWDELEKLPLIPDNVIPLVSTTVAAELGGVIGKVEKRERGWHIWIELESGWKWLLRLSSFSDFAYMLYEPGVKDERYRSDCAPDHAELKFFPVHEHSAPNKKKDAVSPSYLYGHPFFDLKRFKDVGEHLGAC